MNTKSDHYYGDKIVLEPETNNNQNDITDVFLTNNGSGYISLPSITITSSGGLTKNFCTRYRNRKSYRIENK